MVSSFVGSAADICKAAMIQIVHALSEREEVTARYRKVLSQAMRKCTICIQEMHKSAYLCSHCLLGSYISNSKTVVGVSLYLPGQKHHCVCCMRVLRPLDTIQVMLSYHYHTVPRRASGRQF